VRQTARLNEGSRLRKDNARRTRVRRYYVLRLEAFRTSKPGGLMQQLHTNRQQSCYQALDATTSATACETRKHKYAQTRCHRLETHDTTDKKHILDTCSREKRKKKKNASRLLRIRLHFLHNHFGKSSLRGECLQEKKTSLKPAARALRRACTYAYYLALHTVPALTTCIYRKD